MIEELKEERERYTQAIQKALRGLLIPDLQDIVVRYWRPAICMTFEQASVWAKTKDCVCQGLSLILHADFSTLPDQLAELGIKDDVDCAFQVQFGVATIITQGHRLDYPVVWEDIVKKDDGTTN
jgi:hypothetical protein